MKKNLVVYFVAEHGFMDRELVGLKEAGKDEDSFDIIKAVHKRIREENP